MSVTESATAPTGATVRRLTTARAMVEGISQEMERDAGVVVLGEDVAKYGGIFSSTTGLLDKFGPQRVIDTPISETAFIGLGIGAAIEGMRPIVELMFADFFGVAMDQIYNHMAKIHFESGGNVRVPMVLMTATGAGYSDAEQHSQCLWGTFAHLPGMKVVVPSNPADAKGLMISAIRDDNPVVYMFHKGIMGLPWMAKNARSIAPVPEEPYETPIGKASIAREGGDATVVTVSRSACPARSRPPWPKPTPACCEPRCAGSPCPTSRSPTPARWKAQSCRRASGSRRLHGSWWGPDRDRRQVPAALAGAARRRGRARHLVRRRRRPGGERAAPGRSDGGEGLG